LPIHDEVEPEGVPEREQPELGGRLGRPVDADGGRRAGLVDLVADGGRAAEHRARAHVDESVEVPRGGESLAQPPGRHGVDVEDLERGRERRCGLPERRGHLGEAQERRDVDHRRARTRLVDQRVERRVVAEVARNVRAPRRVQAGEHRGGQGRRQVGRHDAVALGHERAREVRSDEPRGPRDDERRDHRCSAICSNSCER
jgi:hypothetical protein